MSEWRDRFNGPEPKIKKTEPFIKFVEDEHSSNLRRAVLTDHEGISVSVRVPLFVEQCEDPGRKDFLFREIVQKLHKKYLKAKRGK